MEGYQKFLVENVETVATVENALRTLLFFMPGRLRDSQLKLEAAYSALGLVSWFNDLSIIHYLSSLRQRVKSTPNPGSPPVKEEKEVVENVYFPPNQIIPIASSLTFIRFVELLIEMVAKTSLGKEYKYRAALAVESIKAMIKFWLLFKLKGRMILQHYVHLPQLRDIESIKLYAKEQLADSARKSNRRKRMTISEAKMQIFREQTALDNTTHSPLLGGSTINPSSSSSITAEVLNIMRPIVYLLTILKFGERSWLPLLASFSVDVTSLSLYRNRKTTEMQQFELTRRTILLSFYLLRNPLFKSVTLRILGEGKGESGVFGRTMAAVREYISIYQEQYFYTSAT
ncbi:hypothetical protein PROFUN_12287 [Planoprotostelium fungivorum]|uniref:Peroxisomal membrane protein PEX16 n=1 Tax=Planoprotostelium fungivorum TaxID=1890364 RepID=A0A2P6N7S3_9EUKA|nr:hypothetical protein PROFUN_12287 [Planoprotostelium fungivorum]